MRPREIVRPKTVQHRLKLAKSDAEMYETLGARRTPSARQRNRRSSLVKTAMCAKVRDGGQFCLKVLTVRWRRCLALIDKSGYTNRMNDVNYISLSKAMSKALRHKPERLGITLAPDGSVELSVLVEALNRRGGMAS